MDISTIITINNNAENINELYESINKAFGNIEVSYELIFVNDGSTDKSWEIISKLQKKDPHIKAINFRRYYGESAALQAGFDMAKGDVVMTISATLENSAEDLLKLYQTIKTKDSDVVIGVRNSRYDGRPNAKLKTEIANKIIKFVSKRKFSDITSPMRAFKRDVISNIKLFSDGYMYLPVLATLYGANFEEVSVKHVQPKNPVVRSNTINFIKFIFDITFLKFYVSATTPPFHLTPIRLFGSIGGLSALLGFAGGIYLTAEKMIYNVDIGTRPLLLLSVLLFILGAMFMGFGILGEIIIRNYFESQNKRTYSIKEKLVA